MQFKRKKMVGWYQVKQLATIGLKAIISTLFGNYADRREIQAALSGPEIYDFSDKEDIWFDYIADIGDGFNSTYSVATLLAQEQLVLSNHPTERGEILIMGGDEVYPTPEIHEYDNRLRGPYQAAYPLCSDITKQPALFAIPGNHDWYDGLTNFLKVFCQERHIGNWKTQQKRSYFAIKLPHRYWIWGIDIQLNSDIDQPQKNYFKDIASNEMQPGDKVILCTAEPSWIFKDRYRLNDSYERLKFFENKFIHNYHFKLIATLAGDLHHYARYAEIREEKEALQRITAGGGGAFLHPTHNLNDRLTKLKDESMELKAVFPDKNTSRKLAFQNLLFPYYNPGFALFLGAFYLLMAWVLETDTEYGDASLMVGLSHATHLGEALAAIFRVLIHSPFAFILSIVLILGFTWFADSNAGKSRFTWITGTLHGIIQLATGYLLIWLFSVINLDLLALPLISVPQVTLFTLEMLIAGSIIGGMTMGADLLFASLVLGIHDNEAFSSIRYPDYKNFLRFHLTQKELIIYPVGIDKVVKDWKLKSAKGEVPMVFEGEEVKAHLIEEPVIIRVSKQKGKKAGQSVLQGTKKEAASKVKTTRHSHESGNSFHQNADQ